VPMAAVLIVDYFAGSLFGTRERHWDLSEDAAPRWSMLVPWAAGFVVYQLINPGYISWWASAWTSFGHDIGFTAETWMSASLLSFGTAGIVTLLVRGLAKRPRH
jgi:NCS1 family nucleobase:cation symporter-1